MTRPEQRWNGTTAALMRLALAFALGAGGAVAATYATFETTEQHDKDLSLLRQDMWRIEGKLDQLLRERHHGASQ